MEPLRVLIAEDDPVARQALAKLLRARGFVVTEACDGELAWERLTEAAGADLLVLDWIMPGQDGIELCRRIRATPSLRALYVVLLTAQGSREHILQGLRAGANDYMTKPCDPDELEARINVGFRVVRLQQELAHRVAQLEEALSKVKLLQGLLPICSYCRRIRDDQDYWHQLEDYVHAHSEADFSHGICPDCYKDTVVPELQRLNITAPPLPGRC